MTKISIVVPVYNAERYLAECIDSILTQSYQDFELLLVDDGSKDSSGRICDEYSAKDERIKVIHQQNGGVTSARRKGVEAARGEWVSFVDADDKLIPDGMQKLAVYIEKEPELDIIEGSYVWFYPDGTTKLRKNISHNEGATYFNPQKYSLSLNLSIGPARGPWSKLIRKKLLLESGALNVPRRFTNREDVMMLTTAARTMKKSVLLPDPVYLYRQQFGITAISNKLSFDYWSDYLNYTETVVLKDLLPEWNDVWEIAIKDVFGLIVHGGYIKTGNMPVYFEKNVLPVLSKNKATLHRADATYVNILNLPIVLRYPVCSLLYGAYTLKRRLFGKFFALRSRK